MLYQRLVSCSALIIALAGAAYSQDSALDGLAPEAPPEAPPESPPSLDGALPEVEAAEPESGWRGYLDGVGFESGVSTLGFYAAPSYDITESIGVRAPFYFGSFPVSSNGLLAVQGSQVDGTLDLSSFSLMADYYVGGSAFRVSGGLAFGGYALDLSADALEIDGTTYESDFSGAVEQTNNVAPVVSMGFRRNTASGLGMTLELGAKLATMEATTTGQDALTGQERDDFDDELADFNNTLSDIPAIPFLSIGTSFRF